MKGSAFWEQYKELILGLAMLALTSFYLYNTTSIIIRSTVSVSAKMIPEILGGLVIILGIAQCLAGIKHAKMVRAAMAKAAAEGQEEAPKDQANGTMPVLLTFLLIIAYAFVFEWLGFIISSTACMFLMMLLMSPKAKNKPLLFLGISLLTAVLTYVAFRHGLNLMLPQGLLEGLPF